MKKIKLTKGKYALVDNQDFKWLNQWKWNYQGKYARRMEYSEDGKRHLVYMHRLVNKTPDGIETDHINHNQLDNTRKNLRIATKSQNMWNMSMSKRNTSGIKGVYWDKKNRKWNVKICVNWVKIDLGRFFYKDDAIKIRKEAEVIYHAI